MVGSGPLSWTTGFSHTWSLKFRDCLGASYRWQANLGVQDDILAHWTCGFVADISTLLFLNGVCWTRVFLRHAALPQVRLNTSGEEGVQRLGDCRVAGTAAPCNQLQALCQLLCRSLKGGFVQWQHIDPAAEKAVILVSRSFLGKFHACTCTGLQIDVLGRRQVAFATGRPVMPVMKTGRPIFCKLIDGGYPNNVRLARYGAADTLVHPCGRREE